MMDEVQKWWFNTRTNQVERGLKSNSQDRIGPFETEAEAKNALETVKLRSQKWREEEQTED